MKVTFSYEGNLIALTMCDSMGVPIYTLNRIATKETKQLDQLVIDAFQRIFDLVAKGDITAKDVGYSRVSLSLGGSNNSYPKD